MSLGYALETVRYPHPESLRTKDIMSTTEIGTHVLRPVIHEFPKKLMEDTSYNLEDCLATADYYFDEISASIGGDTIDHRWVLTDNSDARTKSGKYASRAGLDLFGLEDIWLAALVEKTTGKPIKATNTRTDEFIRITSKIGKETEKLRRELGWSLADLSSPDQFISERHNWQSKVTNPTLVDIDIIQ